MSVFAVFSNQPICNGRMEVLQTGLGHFCDSVERISQHIRQNPNEEVVGNVKEAIGHLEASIDEVVAALDGVNASGSEIEHHIGSVASALEKSANTLDWIEHRFPVTDSTDSNSDIPGSANVNLTATPCWGYHQVDNAGFGNVFNSFHEVLTSQER